MRVYLNEAPWYKLYRMLQRQGLKFDNAVVKYSLQGGLDQLTVIGLDAWYFDIDSQPKEMLKERLKDVVGEFEKQTKLSISFEITALRECTFSKQQKVCTEVRFGQ